MLFFEWLRSNRPDLVDRYKRLYQRGAYAQPDERKRLGELVKGPDLPLGRADARPVPVTAYGPGGTQIPGEMKRHGSRSKVAYSEIRVKPSAGLAVIGSRHRGAPQTRQMPQRFKKPSKTRFPPRPDVRDPQRGVGARRPRRRLRQEEPAQRSTAASRSLVPLFIAVVVLYSNYQSWFDVKNGSWTTPIKVVDGAGAARVGLGDRPRHRARRRADVLPADGSRHGRDRRASSSAS